MLAVCSGGQLGMGILPRPLRTPLLHARSCLRSRLYGRSCDAGRLLAYGRRRGGAVCVARPECFPASLQGGADRSRSLRGVVHLRNHAPPGTLSTVRGAAERAGPRNPVSQDNIEFTRKAYSLDTIQETSYPALADLTSDVIARNQDTIQNVRLWDWRPLLQMYQQAQEIRLYYQFYHADVDRYHLPDGYHQVMLSARELSAGASC